MKLLLSAFGCGALFGLGLAVSGMGQPQKIMGFLDIFGAFDPTLAFVMAAAVGVHFIGQRIARRFKAIHASRRSTSDREQDDHSTLMSVCSKGAAHRPDRNRRRVIYLTMELLLNPAKHEAAA